jgi:hypothetical protein
MDWHKKVYKVEAKKSNADAWKKLRDECLKRDKYTCYRCEKISKNGNKLNAHHIMPRSEGGADDITNLITLCEPCHDIVEVIEARSLIDILASNEDKTVKIVNIANLKDDQESFMRPAWHRWVYGGQQHIQGER